jgi:hypothetical protein
MRALEIWGWECAGRGSSTNCSSPFGVIFAGMVFRWASRNSRDDPAFEAEALDDGFVGAEFVGVESAAASVDALVAGTVAAAAEFCAVSCAGGVADFLLRKRVAAPKSIPAATTTVAAIFQ